MSSIRYTNATGASATGAGMIGQGGAGRLGRTSDAVLMQDAVLYLTTEDTCA